MMNTRRKPDYSDTLVPSRQLIYEVSNLPEFHEVRDAYEKALRNIKGWQSVPAHHLRRGGNIKATPDVLQWPRGVSSEAIYNMVTKIGKQKVIEALWFVTSILEDNPSYFVFDTKKKVHDQTPEGMIARANGFCCFLATPKGRIIRKYAGQSYFDRY